MAWTALEEELAGLRAGTMKLENASCFQAGWDREPTPHSAPSHVGLKCCSAPWANLRLGEKQAYTETSWGVSGEEGHGAHHWLAGKLSVRKTCFLCSQDASSTHEVQREVRKLPCHSWRAFLSLFGRWREAVIDHSPGQRYSLAATVEAHVGFLPSP